MRLNISSLMEKKGSFLQVNKEIPAVFVESIPEIDEVLSPLAVELTVINTGEGYLVTGDLSLKVGLRCSRCLKPFQTEVNVAIDELYKRRPEAVVNEELWDENEPFVEGHELDITGLIEDSVLMGIPMKALCQADCKGLCPSCGVDLAKEVCDCLSPEIDIRLSPLSKLLEQMSED